MKARILILAVLGLSICAGGARAQFWEKKEWRDWSKEDARKMQEDSPWSKTWSTGEVRSSSMGYSSEGTGRETTPRIYYAVQLRSSLPVRQGVVRQMQIDRKYDKMSEAEKKAFDESVQSYLSKTYDNVIVVHIMYWSNVTLYERRMSEYWKGFPEGSYPVGTFMTIGKERIAPIRFVSPPGGAQEFEFIFPRLVNGEDILTPQTKNFSVEFTHPGINPSQDTNQAISRTGASGEDRVFVEFKVEKMKFKGSLVY